MTRRQERVAERVHRVLSELLIYQMQDPRLAGVTVTRADMTADLRRATVYLLPQGSPEEQQAALAALHHARGYIRHVLAEQLQLRFVPEVDFVPDQELARGERVEHLLDELKD